MFRKCIVGFALCVALAAGSFALGAPHSHAIPIRKVNMQSRTNNWSQSPKRFDTSATVVTHVCTATLKSVVLPKIQPQQRSLTVTGNATILAARKLNVNPAPNIRR